MIRVAINGYGRIGRSVLRALYESDARSAIQVVAINELADCKTICHLTRHDSTHGRFPGIVEISDDQLEYQWRPHCYSSQRTYRPTALGRAGYRCGAGVQWCL